MHPSPLLRMRNISKEFPGVRALVGVDFDVEAGEVHVLVGENGAGKSTLIKILSGVYAPDHGEIAIRGHPVRIHSPAEAQRLGISTIYQEFFLVPQLSVAENVFLGREPMLAGMRAAIDWKELRKRTSDLLTSLGLNIDPRAKVEQLGIAEQQLVEIAKALSMNVRILILDEPSAVLSGQEVDRLFGIILHLRAQGVSSIYISHRLEEVKEIGDRATVLRDGRYVATVPAKTVQTDDLISLMIGREIKEKFPKVEVPAGEELLRVESLSRKGYFEDVSFAVRRGEIVGMAGLVGSGRTEVVRAIFGADRYDSGRIFVKGKAAKPKSPGDGIRLGMGFLPSDRKREGLVLQLPIKDNITMSSLDSLSRFGVIRLAKARSVAAGYVARLDIKTPSLGRLTQYLSGGNQQKVVLAKALCRQSEIFICDEPTRGVDVGAKVEIYHLLCELVAQGAGIIMISSELPEILGMSDRIVVMRRGRITGDFQRSEASQEMILNCAFGKVAVEAANS